MTNDTLPENQSSDSSQQQSDETSGILEVPAKLIEALRDAIKDLPPVFRFVIAMTILAVVLIFVGFHSKSRG